MRECASDLSTTMPCHEGVRGGTGVLMCVHIELKWYSNLNTAIHSFAATRARVALSFPRSVAGWLAGASVGSRLLLLWVYRRTNRLAVVDDDEWRAGLNSILMILNTVVGDWMDRWWLWSHSHKPIPQQLCIFIYLFIYLHAHTSRLIIIIIIIAVIMTTSTVPTLCVLRRRRWRWWVTM